MPPPPPPSLLLLLLLMLLLLLLLPAEVQSSTAAPNVTNVTTISIGVIWEFSNAITAFQRLFSEQFLPSLRSSCSSSGRFNTTVIQPLGFNVDSLPTIPNLEILKERQREFNFVLMGVQNNSITEVIEVTNFATSIPELPSLQWTTVSPMPQYLLNDAIRKVMQQLVSESLYKSNPLNYQAAFILGVGVQLAEMESLFRFFSLGSVYYEHKADQLEQILLEIKHSRIINIIAIVDETQGDQLKVAAFALNMLAYQYRWIFHGPRLNSADFDSRMVTHSKNITSIEFGRVADALRRNLRTTHEVMLHDLLSTWQPYLRKYLCNQSSEVNTSYTGFSGTFSMPPGGPVVRSSWHLQIYRGLEKEKKHIGEWRSDGYFEMLNNPDSERNEFQALIELQQNPFRIVTVLSPPYVMYKSGVRNSAPLNDRLTGMYIEVCKLLLQKIGITNYQFFLQPDGYFGIFNRTWNGMIRTVLDGKAHMACGPLTESLERRKVIKFTRIIHSSEQSLLFRNLKQDPMAEIFQFIQPLDSTIWLGILGVLVFVAVVIAVMHRVIPNRGVNLNFYNSLYFSFAEVVQGTSGAVPIQLSGRIVVGFFWFFTLFLLLTYIANYAAYRLLGGVQTQVTSLETLLQNSAYVFGTLRNTVTINLLKTSTFIHMQQVYKVLLDRGGNSLVDNITTAMAAVNNASENYVLIGDHAQNKYLIDTGCDLTFAGKFYDLENALVVPNGSEYLSLLNEQILRSAANITSLQQQFFTVPASQRPDCQDRSFLGTIRSLLPPNPWEVKADALTLANTMGIALINLVGCLIALALSGLERCFSRVLKSRSDGRRQHQKDEAYHMAQRPTMRE